MLMYFTTYLTKLLTKLLQKLLKIGKIAYWYLNNGLIINFKIFYLAIYTYFKTFIKVLK